MCELCLKNKHTTSNRCCTMSRPIQLQASLSTATESSSYPLPRGEVCRELSSFRLLPSRENIPKIWPILSLRKASTTFPKQACLPMMYGLYYNSSKTYNIFRIRECRLNMLYSDKSIGQITVICISKTPKWLVSTRALEKKVLYEPEIVSDNLALWPFYSLETTLAQYSKGLGKNDRTQSPTSKWECH